MTTKMTFNKDDVIIVKLVTGEEVIGTVSRKFVDGTIELAETKAVLLNEIGCYMEQYIPFAVTQTYTFPSHAIVTVAIPIPELLTFYHKKLSEGEPNGGIVSSLSSKTQH